MLVAFWVPPLPTCGRVEDEPHTQKPSPLCHGCPRSEEHGPHVAGILDLEQASHRAHGDGVDQEGVYLDVQHVPAMQVPEKKEAFYPKGQGTGDLVKAGRQAGHPVMVEHLEERVEEEEAKHGHMLAIVGLLKVPIFIKSCEVLP